MSSDPYGPAFARLYDARWDHWSRLAWPRIAPHLQPVQGAPRRWLDLCCGTGSLLRLAGDAGYAATGVDRSPHQLAHAARKAPGARLIEADVIGLKLAGRFDIITSIFDSLNYLLRPRELERVFRWVRHHLAPAGVFLFDVKTGTGFAQERTKILRSGGDVAIFESAFDVAAAIHTFTVTGFVLRGVHHRRFDEAHVQRAYDAEEVADILRRAGLAASLRDFDTGGRVRRTTRRLWCVGRAQV